MKWFIEALHKSIYNLPWLKTQKVFPGRAWAFFALLNLIAALLIVLPVLVELRPSELRRIAGEMPDFDAKVENGKLSVSKLKQPFIQRSADGDFLYVVDTGTGTAKFSNYVSSTAPNSVLITSDEVTLRNADGQERVQKWSQLPSLNVNKEQLVQSMNFVFFLLMALVLFIFSYVVLFISRLYEVLLVSLLVTLASKFSNHSWKWKEIFTVGLFSVTLPSIIAAIVTLTRIGISYIFFIAFFAFMLALVFTKDGTEPQDDDIYEE